MRDKWLKLIRELDHINACICPNCGKSSIDYLYVGDETTRIGYLLIWCKECTKGIYVSRVSCPQNLKYITFEEADIIKLPQIEFI